MPACFLGLKKKHKIEKVLILMEKNVEVSQGGVGRGNSHQNLLYEKLFSIKHFMFNYVCFSIWVWA